MRTKYLYYYLTTHKKNPPLTNLPTLENLKKEYIGYLLKLTDNDIKETAEILDISPETLTKKLDKHLFRH
ncbi:MAG: helix-turn-helix domain-containing protein [Candidatus Aminicenantes bacterium]